MIKDFLLPDLGEGLTEGDILKWTVSVGDTVAVNDTIAEVETVKAAVELPSPFAGVVTALHAAEGETVPVGKSIISIDVGGAAAGAPAEEEQQLTLVGYGPRDETATPRRRHRPPVVDAAPPATESAAPTEPARPAAHRVLAKPPVRKLAKTLGVDLGSLVATGPNGTVSREDVQQAVQAPGAAPTGRETRIPIKGVRKHTAAAMVASAFTAPHVTEFVTFDITATMELRDRVAARREFRDLKVSPLLFVAKAVLLAARRTPELNSSWDEAAGEIVQKHYVNLGIAAATDRGLVVPNIKDAHELSLLELAHAIADLTETARSGKATPADMSGGTFTVTNIGVFGVDTGTPILNPGEAGILAFGAIRRQPWVVGSGAAERIEPRWVTQLALSFDHRLVDGQQGSQFLADVAAVLRDPGLALL
ncbi:dihydrolipoamide acetyltransferase family protein [Jatrophihabitans sp.]|uniref:dihydrolipoamide acetyltransferase family protein n=1 Tax=Jatrophihabitans sp. TaxID=1932789 RepID=UPI0030C73385|nr:catalytic domain of component of various dehydrogenase complexe [Jatrophihabitans sp.]